MPGQGSRSNLSVGASYVYEHPDGKGFGEHHMGVDVEQTGEMRELDLDSGHEVVLEAVDEDTGRPIVNWTDAHGIDRMTSIDPAFFDQYFRPV